jgi:hypothetical protein
MLKMDQYDTAIPLMYRMIKVMVLLKKPDYVRVMLLNAHVLSYQKRKQTFFHTMISNNPGCLSEEAGEMSFAVLGRLIGNDSHKSDFQHMSDY